MECQATMQPVRLTSTRCVRVMGYKIGALQHLLRHLFEEYLHRWNVGLFGLQMKSSDALITQSLSAAVLLGALGGGSDTIRMRSSAGCRRV